MAIICQCAVVRERSVVKAIRHGATTLDAVRDACGAASVCGGCTPTVLALLERHAGETDAHERHHRPEFAPIPTDQGSITPATI